jgi:hypothetical protein
MMDRPKDSMIHGGVGASVRRIGDSYVIGARAEPMTFAPAFALRYFADEIEVGFGTVNDIEPRIGGALISGVEDGGQRPPPRLRLPDNADVEGRLWICAQVKVNKDGRIDAADVNAVTIVTENNPRRFLARGDIGLYPLGLIRANEEVWQIAFFNLRHAVVNPAEGTGFRHFFWSV